MTRIIRIFVVATAFLAAPPAVIAQSEKVSIRLAPSPGQTVRLTLAHEIDMDISFDGAAAAPGIMPMKMVVRMTMLITQKTGALNPDGTVDSEFTYDQFRTEMSMNGQTMPADINNPLIANTVVVTYNRNGDVVRIQGMPAGPSDDMLSQLMGAFVGNLPATALGVGETATAPMDLTLPLPLPLPGAPVMKMVGQTQLRLVSLDKDARGRSARFESTTAGSMASDLASPDGQGKMSIDLNLSGEGTYVINLDTGVLRSNIVTSRINGKMNMAGSAASPALPGMTMRGTIKLTLTSD